MELQNKNDKKRDVKEEEYQLEVPEESFWEGIKRHVRSYCDIASIQGLNYMAKDGVSWFERAWWILVFILCVGGCSYMVFKIIDKWNTTPVLVSLATKETSIHEVPFPAVTICPETKVSRSCLNYTETLKKRRTGKGSEVELMENLYFDFMSLLCRPSNHLSSFDSFQETNESGKPFDDNIFMLDDYAEFLDMCKSVTLDNAYCKWMGKVVDCEKILTPILTDEGLCYSFNMFDVRDIYSDVNKMEYYEESRRNPDWDPDSGYPEGKLEDVYPRRAFTNGAKNALEVVLLTKKSDVYYSCRDFALQGIRVTLNMPGRIPRPSQVFFSVGFDRLTTVAVTPSYMTTTPTIKEYDPQDRNCYFGTERNLKYFKLYSQSNCNMECFTNYTINYCGCTHFYMPNHFGKLHQVNKHRVKLSGDKGMNTDEIIHLLNTDVFIYLMKWLVRIFVYNIKNSTKTNVLVQPLNIFDYFIKNPFHDNVRVVSYFYFIKGDANTSICSLDKRFCLEEARVNYPMSILSEHLKSNKKSKSDGTCDCLPMCTDLNYNSEISSGFWTINAEEEYEISKEYHASAVKVFFKSSYFLPTEKSELYGFTDFVSNAGGVLGLFTGFSLFSLAEIIYFLSIRLIENYRRYGYWAGERVPVVLNRI